MQIIHKKEIEATLDYQRAFTQIRFGFLKIDNDEVVLPPVGTLLTGQGSLHIKYGYITGDNYFYVKHSTGFPANAQRGLPTSDGCILAFEQHTGRLACMLLDEGYLTHVRTALAASVLVDAYTKAPKCISILGSGMQAYYQAKVQQALFPKARIQLWARRPDRIKANQMQLAKDNISTHIADTLKESIQTSDVVISATASNSFFIKSEYIPSNMLLIALGADEAGKQELEPELLLKANTLIVDAWQQCRKYGELQHLTDVQINSLRTISVGQYIEQASASNGLIIADLTGVAAQDIQIANTVLHHYPRMKA